MKDRTIAIIPARGGSKRLPGKNTKLLGGIPLLAHSILYAQQNSKIIEAVYVSTDDAEIKSIALEYGAQIIDRPKHLAGDMEPTVSTLKHVLETLKGGVENVVLLQPTNPLRPTKMLEEAFAIYLKQEVDSLFTVSANHRKLGTIRNHHFVPLNYKLGQRSQDMAPLYFENGLLYISKTALILKDKIMSETAFPLFIDHPFGYMDIDTLEDWERVEYLFEKHKGTITSTPFRK